MKREFVTPINWTRGKPLATAVTIAIIFDDLHTGATFQATIWAGDSVIDTVNVSCLGSNYAGWNGNNDYPVQFVCNALQLELKPVEA